MLRIVQLLCPKRHALSAALYDDDKHDQAAAAKMIEDEYAKQGGVKRCGICGSEDIKTEDGKSAEQDPKTAQRNMTEAAVQNMVARLRIEQLRRFERASKN